MAVNIDSILNGLGIPVAYGLHKERTPLPYIVWLGSGQDTFDADNTHYIRENTYRIEFYFKLKDPSMEERLEQILLDNGLLYEKSEDVYLEDEGVFMIYYYI